METAHVEEPKAKRNASESVVKAAAEAAVRIEKREQTRRCLNEARDAMEFLVEAYKEDLTVVLTRFFPKPNFTILFDVVDEGMGSFEFKVTIDIMEGDDSIENGYVSFFMDDMSDINKVTTSHYPHETFPPWIRAVKNMFEADPVRVYE